MSMNVNTMAATYGSYQNNYKTGITYSAIKSNRKQNTKQNASTELESKMMQYTDTLSISKTGQENFKHLTSVSSMDYVHRFEKEVTDVFAKEDTAQDLKSDTFEHHVSRMAAAYDKMKNTIEEKCVTEEREPEYYVTDSGKIEELTKEKELDMLDKAYKNHSNFMAASTEIWSELKDFTPTVVYHLGNGQAEERSVNEDSGKVTTKTEEKGKTGFKAIRGTKL